MRLYSWLLKLYPARFREEYSIPMERQFLDDQRDVSSAGEKARLWINTIADLAMTIPPQIVDELWHDVKSAVRSYRRRSGSILFAVAALGLAMGVTTGVFSVISALLLRSLPFSSPSQLVELWFSPFTALQGRTAFKQWERNSEYLQNAATFSSSEMNIDVGREALRLSVAETSAAFFSVLGSEPLIGRTFARDEEVYGRNRVAVLSYRLWQQVYGGDSGAIGRTLELNGMPLTIIGVMRPQFDYPGNTALWAPTAFDIEYLPKRGAFIYQTVGRLKDGVTLKQAQGLFRAEVDGKQGRAARTSVVDQANVPHLVSLQSQLAGPVREGLWVLGALTALLLATACANVAQLLLSRAIERRSELEVRAALGASRARLLQQLITEAALLSSAGAVVGLFVAQWTCQLAAAVSPAALTTQNYTVFDWRVLAFAIGLAGATGLMFGVIPAWFVSRLYPSELTVRASSSTRSSGTRRIRWLLLSLQAALTICLLIASFTLGRTFLDLLHADLGFRPENVVTLTASVQGTSHTGAGEWQYYTAVLHRIGAIPGVASAGAVSYLPLANDIYMAESFTLDSGQKIERVVINSVTPGYFATMGTPILAGADFRDNVTPNAYPVIVNESFAHRLGLGQTIVGRRLTVPWNGPRRRVIGIVKSVRFGGPAYAGEPQVYFPAREEPPAALTFAAHVSGNPEQYLARLRVAAREVDPKVPIYGVKTLDERLEENLARPRFYTTATTVLSGLALLLAMVGVYGTTAHAIAQQRHELGIRMAVGATHGMIRLAILARALTPLFCGSAAGILVSLLSNRMLRHLMEAVPKPGAAIYFAASLFLLLIGAVSAWISSAGILRIDPAAALRSE